VIPLRDENPAELRPFVTVSLLAACVLAFLWQISGGAEGHTLSVYRLGVVPAALLGDARLPPEIAAAAPMATVFTSMFLHGGWMHLIGNMLYLWIFGNNIEDAMGHARFLIFYLICGIAAVLAQALPDPDSTIPMVGASGAISGILGAYLLLFPHARVLVLVPLGYYTRLMHIKAAWALGLWFLFQVLSSINVDTSSGGVAFGAHIGGFIAGMALVPLFKRRSFKLLART